MCRMKNIFPIFLDPRKRFYFSRRKCGNRLEFCPETCRIEGKKAHRSFVNRLCPFNSTGDFQGDESMIASWKNRFLSASVFSFFCALASASAVAEEPAAGSKKGAAEISSGQKKTEFNWKTSDKLGKGKKERSALIEDFCAGAKHSWEKALTEKEAEALLDDPRAELLYPEKTVSIVAPSMLKRQRKGHVDLLALFLKPERIDAGVKFMEEHEKILEDVEKRHGVDREVIVSILMWESKLGTITGDYFAFNSFVSQAFFIDEANSAALERRGEATLIDEAAQNKRVEKIRNRARTNLVVLVRVAKARGIDPLAVKGSWAGALGFPQFMPASLQWAEDGDGDGKIDLFTFPDSIASIGRYLKAHGFGKTEKSHRKAVWGYNHEAGYVNGVLEFAAALKARRLPDESSPDPEKKKSDRQ